MLFIASNKASTLALIPVLDHILMYLPILLSLSSNSLDTYYVPEVMLSVTLNFHLGSLLFEDSLVLSDRG